MSYIAIYGFSFTRKIVFDGGVLTPIFTSAKELRENKCNGREYILSGFFSPTVTNYVNHQQLVSDLAAVLSFIEQKNVVISGELEEDESPENFKPSLPKKLNGLRHPGLGYIIREDYIAPDSRKHFISLAMNALNNRALSEGDPFRTAFYKSMLAFRESIDYVDVSYYLNFSALESLCRHILNDYSYGEAPKKIAKALSGFGFDIVDRAHPTPQRNTYHYNQLRNSLFHNGKHFNYLDKNDPASIIYIRDYSANLKMLVSLALVKYIGFDDKWINWDSWIDRIPFNISVPK